MNKAALYRQYRELWLEGIVPFWARHGLDGAQGGVLTCLAEDGTPVSTDKHIWSQARWVWTCSALYNRIEQRPEFLAWARSTIDFLLRHGRDEQGRPIPSVVALPVKDPFHLPRAAILAIELLRP